MVLATKPRSEVPINLLPPQVRAEQRARRAFRWAVIGAITVGVVLLTVTVLQRLQIAGENSTLQAQRAEAARVQERVDALRQFEVLQLSVGETRRVLGTALANDLAWSSFLDELDTTFPGDAWVTNVTFSAKPGQTPTGESSLGTVQYQGYVMSFPGLSGWIDTMEKTEGMRFVYLSNGAKQDLGGSKVVSFTASAHITESMLSGRCQKEGAPCP